VGGREASNPVARGVEKWAVHDFSLLHDD
jgi:hypothetical protein